jgi:hypothetical protein
MDVVQTLNTNNAYQCIKRRKTDTVQENLPVQTNNVQELLY